MNANRFHARRPEPLSPADRARQAAAVARMEKRNAWKRAKSRLSRLAVICIAIGLTVALFYSATN